MIMGILCGNFIIMKERWNKMFENVSKKSLVTNVLYPGKIGLGRKAISVFDQ